MLTSFNDELMHVVTKYVFREEIKQLSTICFQERIFKHVWYIQVFRMKLIDVSMAHKTQSPSKAMRANELPSPRH